MTMVTIPAGIKLGTATTIVDIVPKGNPEIRPGYSMVPTMIAEHNTGNAGRGANAEAHNKYIHNQARLPVWQTGYASWHFTVDEHFIFQHIPLNETAWHTGDGSGKNSGNMNAIGIEICMHSDQKNYHQAEENAIALTAYLMRQFNIPINKVKPHQDFSGKYCPQVILKRDGTFARFRARIDAAYQLGVGKVQPAKPKYYRLQSGTYTSIEQAEAARKKLDNLGIAGIKWSKVVGNGKLWRWVTGTYESKWAAEAARKRTIDNKIAWVVDILEA